MQDQPHNKVYKYNRIVNDEQNTEEKCDQIWWSKMFFFKITEKLVHIKRVWLQHDLSITKRTGKDLLLLAGCGYAQQFVMTPIRRRLSAMWHYEL